MKFALLTIVLIFNFAGASAQNAAGGGHRADSSYVYGKVADSAGKPVGNASVMVLKEQYDPGTGKTKSILLKGTATKPNGAFSLDGLPTSGKLKLSISAIGYLPYEQEFSFGASFNGAASGKDLGNINLRPAYNHLQTVVVTAAKPLIRMGVNKKIFNVDKNIVAAGGTAVDIMRNVPSLKVDMNGNVTMRNASPLIYINDKPTTLTLDQIPANEIASVEIITNPPARYEASGGKAGILNIILKKSEKAGYTGNIHGGLDSRGGFNAGGNFNIQKDKFNFFTSLRGSQTKNKITGTTARYSLTDRFPVNVFQDNLNKTEGESFFGRMGFDYFLTDRTTLSAAGIKTYTKLKYRETIDIITDSILAAGTKTVPGNRLSAENRELNGTTIALAMKHKFPAAGEELTADLNFSDMKWDGNGLYTSTYPNAQSGSLEQKNLVGGHNKLLTLQTDYIKPISGTTKFEAGLRVQVTDISNENENYIQYPGDSDFEKIAAATTNYSYNNNVYAVYASFASAGKGGFGYELGLRAERSDYTGELLNTGEKFSDKHALSFFPAIFLSQDLENGQKLQLSVTRRITRPTSFQLTPYTDYTDNLNLTRGNPDLVPEFTNAAEISYSKTFNAIGSVLASVYYKRTNNLITQNLLRGENPVTGEDVFINTFVNASSGESYGAELTSIHHVENWWELLTNINFYNSRIDNHDLSYASRDPLWSLFAKLTSNFSFPKGLTLQLSADYQGKSNLPVTDNLGSDRSVSQAQSSSKGYLRAFFGVDVAINKTFLKDNAAAVTLGINDIFRSRKFDQYTEGPGFTQNYYRLNNPQHIRLNFTYRFGNKEMPLSEDGPTAP